MGSIKVSVKENRFYTCMILLGCLSGVSHLNEVSRNIWQWKNSFLLVFCKKKWLKYVDLINSLRPSDIAIIGSDNGLSPGRRQAIIWTNAGILLIGPLGTNISEIWIRIQTFWLKKIHLKMSSAKWRLFCLGHNVLSWVIAVGMGNIGVDTTLERRKTFLCHYILRTMI